jgi:hypothetical protein
MNKNTTATYTVVTQHVIPGSDTREVRKVSFPTWEAARDYAESTNFVVDGSMFPNLDFDLVGDEVGEYSSGFWHLDNKYAAVFGPAIEA